MWWVPLGGGVKLRDIAELRITLLQHDIEWESAKTSKVVLKLFADHRHGCGAVADARARGPRDTSGGFTITR